MFKPHPQRHHRQRCLQHDWCRPLYRENLPAKFCTHKNHRNAHFGCTQHRKRPHSRRCATKRIDIHHKKRKSPRIVDHRGQRGVKFGLGINLCTKPD